MKSRFNEICERVIQEADGAGPVATGFEALLDEVRNADALGKPDRREKIAEILNDLKEPDLKDLNKIQIKILDIAKNPTLKNSLNEIMSKLQTIDAKVIADFEKLSARLYSLISSAKFDSPDSKRHFIDSLKMAFANVNDADLEKIYDLENQFIKLIRLA